MQLESSPRPAGVRGRLRAAACVLLAAGVPAAARADDAAPKYQLDASGLLYGEQGRAKVVEPVAKLTRLFGNGASLGAQFTLDVITGASPTGARPTTSVQTITNASGTSSTVQANQLPVTAFHDRRMAGDIDWTQPIGALFNAITSAHASVEKDYNSMGAGETFSLDTFHRLITWSLGGSFSHDLVYPVGGTPVGLTSGGQFTGVARNPKDVTSLMTGVSRILSRQWMVALNATSIYERGYLTEPYKVVSILDPATQNPISFLTENRPDRRQRYNVTGSSVYHLLDDVFYASYRYYWDDWQLTSHTVDLRFRHELGNDSFLQPHLRFYTQSAAKFFTLGLVQGAPLPDYASSDQRLSHFNSVTLGLTYGFKPRGYPGEWTVRAEYIAQFQKVNLTPAEGADGEPVQTAPDAFPLLNIGTLTAGYSLSF